MVKLLERLSWPLLTRVEPSSYALGALGCRSLQKEVVEACGHFSLISFIASACGLPLP